MKRGKSWELDKRKVHTDASGVSVLWAAPKKKRKAKKEPQITLDTLTEEQILRLKEWNKQNGGEEE